MAEGSGQPLIAALDIGSSKVSALIATQDGERRLRVLGTGQRESRGVKRGFITDVEASEFAVREAVELAERMSGVTIDDVWASYGAGGVTSNVANVEVILGGHQIEQADIDELLAAGRNSIDRGGQVVLHAHPALYTIDGVEGVQHPIGLHADRLGVDIHVIAADPAPLRNIDFVIRSAHLGVKAIVASPVAAALACLTEDERDLGVALVELGAGVTNVSLHVGGMLVGLRSIALGAKDITDDIACAFAVQRRDAERLKCF
ncbi:MAG TPA: cell division protein FtsA, partial [Sphingomicrobium sp.]|nr:cell division protein FtsA [Sphingomicrobium sp.]